MNRPLAVVLALILLVSTVGALHQGGHNFTESFEDEEFGDDWDVTRGSDIIEVSDNRAFDGNWSARLEDEPTSNDRAHITSNFSDGAVNETINGEFNLTFYYYTVEDDRFDDREVTYTVRESGTQSLEVTLASDVLEDDARTIIRGEAVDDVSFNRGNPPVNEWVRVSITGNDTHISVNASDVNGDHYDVSTTRNGTITPEDTQIRLEYNAVSADDPNTETYFDLLTGLDASAKFDGLELEVKTFMAHGSEQTYQVFQVDDGEHTDITNDPNLNVTSGDPSVITVHESNNTLEATSDGSVNQEVTITAEYNGTIDTQDVTVANKTLDNIAILPPATWPSAIFGHPGETTGSSGTWPGAIQLQWIFVALSIGAVVSWKARVGMLGALVVLGMLTFGWAIDWVADGMLIAAIIFMVYALAVLCGKSRSAGEVVGGFC